LETTFADDLLVVSRHLPLTLLNPSIHPNAVEAAQAAEAAGRQGKFHEMSDLLLSDQATWSGLADPTATFEGYASDLSLNLPQFQTDMADPAVLARIQRDADDAVALGAQFTPLFYLNGALVSPNPPSLAAFESLVQQAVDDYEKPFKINLNTGQILVATPSELDFETTPVFVITVNATDETGFTESISVTINLTDQSEPASLNVEGEAAAYAAAVDELLADEESFAEDDALHCLAWP
tara:strand:+ start:715 stop:1428 length:714 start_codon:yes stop_codon:yes gene_type:complete